MNPGPARDALTLVAGVLTGMLSGAFGVGGAVISTPAVRVLGASALLAVGTTLPSIFPSALTGTIRYTRERLVDWSIVVGTTPAGLGAAVAGSLLSHVVPGHGHVLMVITAGLIAFTAVRMVPGPGASVSDAARARTAAGPGAAEAWEPGHPGHSGHPGHPGTPGDPGHPGTSGTSDHPGTSGTSGDLGTSGHAGTADDPGDQRPGHAPPGPRRRRTLMVLTGVLAGALSGLLGVGGGVILVPAYVELLDLPIKTAIATSLACVGLLAVPSTVSHALLGDIDWGFALFLGIGVVPGAWLGSSLATRASDRRLRLAVAGFLGLVSIVYAAGEIAALL
jgi:uncharacterized membrane protein YfcA